MKVRPTPQSMISFETSLFVKAILRIKESPLLSGLFYCSNTMSCEPEGSKNRSPSFVINVSFGISRMKIV